MQASSVAFLRRFVAGLASVVTSLGLAPAALASAGPLLAPTTDPQEAPEIRLPSEHSAFPLTGKATIHGVLAARGPLPKGLLEFRLGDVKFSEKETPALRKNRTLPFLVPFEAGAFSEGEHVLTVVWKGASQQVQAQKTIRLGRLPSPDAMPVWLWMYGGPQNAEFYKWAGFTSVGGPPVPQKPDVSLESQLDDVRTVAEQSVLQGLMLSSSPANSLLPRDFSALPSLPLASARYKGTSAESKDYLDPFDPAVQHAQDTINDKFVAALAPFPNWKYAFVDMEYQDYLTKPSLSAHAAAYLTKKKGLPPEVLKQLKPGLGYAREETGAPSWVAKGVIADHDIKLRLVRATHSGGNGVNRALQGIKEALRRNKRPDVQIITCPYRSNPVKRMYSGADIISSWTYTNPDPKYMLFTETLRAACGEGQTPMHTITLLNYPGTLMPSEKGWTMISPDIAKLSSWIDLSRVPKILSFFYSSMIDPVKFAADTERVPPETSAALAEMADKVYRPLGELIRQLQLFPRKAALLNSQTARLYPASLALIGYPGYDILPFQCVLEMAHIPADVVLDEDVETGALDKYKVLFLPKCDAITAKMDERIRAFLQGGGVVVADQYLGPDLPGVIRFNFDFSRRKNVTADAIAKGTGYAQWDDHVLSGGGKAEMKPMAGFTAEEDQRMMESYARELIGGLPDLSLRPVDTDSLTTLLSLAEGEGAYYLFVLNDKRAYSDRLRPYQSQLDQMVPQNSTIRLLLPELASCRAYDLIEHREVPIAHDPTPRLDVALDRLGGKLIAFYPQEIAAIRCTAPNTVERGRAATISVKLSDAANTSIKGMQPVRVTMYDPSENLHETQHVLLRNGEGSLRFVAPWKSPDGTWRIAIKDLSSGKTTHCQIVVGEPPGNLAKNH